MAALQPASQRRKAAGAAHLLMMEGGEEEDAIEDAMTFKKGQPRRKSKKDQRDRLLYDVTEVTPPPTRLGQFRLGPSAACGDLISARMRFEGESEKLDHTFVIKRVSYRYEYQGGTYRMVGKGAQVKRADRYATESFLERLLPSSSLSRGSSRSSR